MLPLILKVMFLENVSEEEYIGIQEKFVVYHNTVNHNLLLTKISSSSCKNISSRILGNGLKVRRNTRGGTFKFTKHYLINPFYKCGLNSKNSKKTFTKC